MKKLFYITGFLITFFSTANSQSPCSLPSNPTSRTFYVSVAGNDVPNCGNQNNPCATIQYAIWRFNNLSPRFRLIIHVLPGTYYQNVSVNSSFVGGELRIIGNSPYNTHLVGTGNGSVIAINKIDLKGSIEKMKISNGTGTLDPDVCCSTGTHGGGIYVRYSVIHLLDLIIENNQCHKGGGVIFFRSHGGQPNQPPSGPDPNLHTAITYSSIRDFCYPVVNRCIIRNNTADGGGGIHYHSDNNYHPRIANTLIADNNAIISGGGISIDYSTQLIASNITVANNHAIQSGGAVFGSNNTSIVANNSIFWDSGANNPYNFIAGASAVFDHCDVEYMNTTPPPSFINCISNNPNLNCNYQLLAGSPCINAGSNGLRFGNKDLANNNRIQGGNVDIGTYEGVGPACINAGSNDDLRFGNKDLANNNQTQRGKVDIDAYKGACLTLNEPSVIERSKSEKETQEQFSVFGGSSSNVVGSLSLDIFPSVTSQNFVNIRLKSDNEGRGILGIFNLEGKLLQNVSVHILSGVNILTIPVDNLTPGMYFLRVNFQDKNIGGKFIKI